MCLEHSGLRFFYKYHAQMSKMFGESLHRCWRAHDDILTGPMSATFVARRSAAYSNAISKYAVYLITVLALRMVESSELQNPGTMILKMRLTIVTTANMR